MKILCVFGTRPEAIKMAPVILSLREASPRISIEICVSGQHKEMLDSVLNLFGLEFDYNLEVMRVGQDLVDITSKVLVGMREVLRQSAPDLVLVHGDTTTSFAAALASFYANIKVGHVEAGLRTNDIFNPWPEEFNRKAVSLISGHHFAPTESSKANLISEGIVAHRILVTGNTVIDSLFLALKKLDESVELTSKVLASLTEAGLPKNKLEAWKSKSRKLVLITGHRRESFGGGFQSICRAIQDLAKEYIDTDFVYPVHLNPNVRSAVYEIFGDDPFKKWESEDPMSSSLENLYFIEPLDYLSFILLMRESHIVMTDSGGIQEEAPSLGKPVIVLRETTERPEALEVGTVRLVGTNRKLIFKEVEELLTNDSVYDKMSQRINPYGDGRASVRIRDYLLSL
jgi:UDP-N-acetylglucosamine 2-epimerase (non-hydrolysing)